MGEFDLLQKTELRIERIELCGANLTAVAAVVADILGLERHEVLVTDVLGDVMTIDILRKTADAYRLVGKRECLLEELSRLPGVRVTEATTICSEGMLGWIALDRAQAKKALKRVERLAKQIRQRMSKRVIIFSTGAEVASGQIMDTNTPAIHQRLETEGYSVTLGPTLPDDELLIAANLRQAVDDGYGLVVITGGVGAEDKDRTIEAVLALDSEAAAEYICKYQKGTGRHHKDGVKIAVGQVSQTLIVALPGPNDEVKSSLNVLVNGLSSGSSKQVLAKNIASVLRKKLQQTQTVLD